MFSDADFNMRAQFYEESKKNAENEELDTFVTEGKGPAKINLDQCIFCGKGGCDVVLFPDISYHSSCLSCPQCGENEMII